MTFVMGNSFSVKGKKVFITGSSGGIGSELVYWFKDVEADVYEDDIKFGTDAKSFSIEPDVLINCAGISNPDTPQSMFEINFWKAYYLCHTFAERKVKGSIINITSIAAEIAMPDNPIYNASKAALRQLTKSIALDYGKYGIRANNVCPGYIRTPMTQKSWDDPEKRKAITDRTMLGRWGMPEDIVGACIFLASDASSYITGSDIYVDGGWMAKGL